MKYRYEITAWQEMETTSNFITIMKFSNYTINRYVEMEGVDMSGDKHMVLGAKTEILTAFDARCHRRTPRYITDANRLLEAYKVDRWREAKFGILDKTHTYPRDLKEYRDKLVKIRYIQTEDGKGIVTVSVKPVVGKFTEEKREGHSRGDFKVALDDRFKMTDKDGYIQIFEGVANDYNFSNLYYYQLDNVNYSKYIKSEFLKTFLDENKKV